MPVLADRLVNTLVSFIYLSCLSEETNFKRENVRWYIYKPDKYEGRSHNKTFPEFFQNLKKFKNFKTLHENLSNASSRKISYKNVVKKNNRNWVTL